MTTQLVNLVEERTPNVTQEPPDWIVREIKKVGGMVSDLSGSGPRFRVIWGGNRFSLAPDGMTLIRPYRVDMWHLEKLHEGEYEHCYRLGECPSPGHRKLASDPWCKQCFMDGGVPIAAGSARSLIETIIHLLLKTEQMQQRAIQSGKANIEQRDALLIREATKHMAKDTAIGEAAADAMPLTVKRSFDTPLRLSAQQALGRGKGLKQLGAKEVLNVLKSSRGKSA